MEEQDQPGIIKDGIFYPAGSGSKIKGKSNKTIVSIGLILIIFIGLIITNNNYNNAWQLKSEYFEEIEDDGTSNLYTINLEIDNSIGDIYIDNHIAENKLIQINTKIYTPKNRDNNYYNYKWDISGPTDNNYYVAFNGPQSTIWNDNKIKYDHYISINNKILFNLNLQTSVGLIDLDLFNSSLNTISLKTGSGDLSSKFVNCEINDTLSIDVSSGSVEMNIENSVINLTELFFQISSGSSNFNFVNNIFNQNTIIKTEVSSGTINVIWYQQMLNHRIDVISELSSGNINYQLLFNENITTNYITDTTSGSENIPNENIGTQGEIFFNLSTVSGNIDIEYTN
ncbi:MAG: hypothetical protein OEY49_07445 [Candidatus Heimdallarchaeota archaeon]|nr:hypothetical protein [Candidatus Heimdallarchaeota archaeon]